MCNLVHFFTFTDFPFLRDWPHVEVIFCTEYHKLVQKLVQKLGLQHFPDAEMHGNEPSTYTNP